LKITIFPEFLQNLILLIPLKPVTLIFYSEALVQVWVWGCAVMLCVCVDVNIHTSAHT
jgi:hypothetical protein